METCMFYNEDAVEVLQGVNMINYIMDMGTSNFNTYTFWTVTENLLHLLAHRK